MRIPKDWTERVIANSHFFKKKCDDNFTLLYYVQDDNEINYCVWKNDTWTPINEAAFINFLYPSFKLV